MFSVPAKTEAEKLAEHIGKTWGYACFYDANGFNINITEASSICRLNERLLEANASAHLWVGVLFSSQQQEPTPRFNSPYYLLHPNGEAFLAETSQDIATLKEVIKKMCLSPKSRVKPMDDARYHAGCLTALLKQLCAPEHYEKGIRFVLYALDKADLPTVNRRLEMLGMDFQVRPGEDGNFYLFKEISLKTKVIIYASAEGVGEQLKRYYRQLLHSQSDFIKDLMPHVQNYLKYFEEENHQKSLDSYQAALKKLGDIIDLRGAKFIFERLKSEAISLRFSQVFNLSCYYDCDNARFLIESDRASMREFNQLIESREGRWQLRAVSIDMTYERFVLVFSNPSKQKEINAESDLILRNLCDFIRPIKRPKEEGEKVSAERMLEVDPLPLPFADVLGSRSRMVK